MRLDLAGIARAGDPRDVATCVQLACERREYLPRVAVADEDHPPMAEDRAQRTPAVRSQPAAVGRPSHPLRRKPMPQAHAKPVPQARPILGPVPRVHAGSLPRARASGPSVSPYSPLF